MVVATSVLADPDPQVLKMLGLADAAITLEAVLARWPWKPIHGCPGRWVLRGEAPELTPSDIIGAPVEPRVFHPESTPDAVLVVTFAGGGLVSFAKPDGVSFVHTLNTPEGLQRRLARFGIALGDR